MPSNIHQTTIITAQIVTDHHHQDHHPTVPALRRDVSTTQDGWTWWTGLHHGCKIHSLKSAAPVPQTIVAFYDPCLVSLLVCRARHAVRAVPLPRSKDHSCPVIQHPSQEPAR